MIFCDMLSSCRLYSKTIKSNIIGVTISLPLNDNLLISNMLTIRFFEPIVKK